MGEYEARANMARYYSLFRRNPIGICAVLAVETILADGKGIIDAFGRNVYQELVLDSKSMPSIELLYELERKNIIDSTAFFINEPFLDSNRLHNEMTHPETAGVIWHVNYGADHAFATIGKPTKKRVVRIVDYYRPNLETTTIAETIDLARRKRQGPNYPHAHILYKGPNYYRR